MTSRCVSQPPSAISHQQAVGHTSSYLYQQDVPSRACMVAALRVYRRAVSKWQLQPDIVTYSALLVMCARRGAAPLATLLCSVSHFPPSLLAPFLLHQLVGHFQPVSLSLTRLLPSSHCSSAGPSPMIGLKVGTLPPVC